MKGETLLIRNITRVQPCIGGLIPAEKILVLAPHQDDEAIGCAGTIVRYLKEGTKVKIIYMTDGRYGVEDFNRKIRDEEAKVAWRDMVKLENQAELVFFDHEDSHLHESSALEELKKQIKEFQPEIIFTPWLLDQHIDHQYTTYFLQKALLEMPEYEVSVAMYEVMSPLYANLYVNVTKEFDQKMEILDAYQSQHKFMHIKECAKSLGEYRGACMHLKAIKQAEAFHFGEKKFFLSVVDELIEIF